MFHGRKTRIMAVGCVAVWEIKCIDETKPGGDGA